MNCRVSLNLFSESIFAGGLAKTKQTLFGFYYSSNIAAGRMIWTMLHLIGFLNRKACCLMHQMPYTFLTNHE